MVCGWVRVEHRMNGGRNLAVLSRPFSRVIMKEEQFGDVNLSLHRHPGV